MQFARDIVLKTALSSLFVSRTVATQSSFQADVPFGSQTKDCTNMAGLGRDKNTAEKL